MIASLFLAVAASYAPETWFHVIGGNASQEGMKADIAAIAEAGISGIQFFHGASYGSADDTWPGVTNPIPCLSDQWIDLVKCAETECHKRGLTFKMQNCPGWSMSGGPWVTIDKAMRKLVAFEPDRKPAFEADDDYHEIGTVTFPAVPELEDGGVSAITFPNPSQVNHALAYELDSDYVVYEDDQEVFRHRCPQGAWQDYAGVTYKLPQRIRRIKNGVSPKIRVEVQGRVGKRVLKETELRFHGDTRILDDWESKAGLGLRSFTMSTNRMPLKVFDGYTKTLVFGHVNAKRKNHPAPPEATGWECDKLDARGFETNFAGYLGKLLKAGVKIDGTLVDSWECSVQTWTWKMEEEFEKRNGYKLRPWLPALFGHVLKSEAETEKFLLDWRNTCSRMIEENYFGTIARLAREHGMTSQYETAFGDVLPGDLMRFWKFADEPMCEFWHPHDNNVGYVGSHDFKPVLPCVSAAHLYGKRRVSAESLTSFKLTFNENFREWKDTIDRHFCRGVTHIVFHTYTHNPIVNGKPPSSSFGSYIGSPFLRLQPWWPYLKDFTAYLARCGRELERGLPVVDILMYLGDAVGHKPHEKTLLFGNRYKYDYLNPDVLHTTLKVEQGRLVVGSYPANASQTEKMSYRVLWIPKDTYVTPESAARIAALEKAGARVIRGDFTPDWPSPLAAIGREAQDLEGWYQRRDGDEDIFFVMEKDDTTRFLFGKDGRWIEYDPVEGTRQDAPRIAPAFGSSLTAGGYASTAGTRQDAPRIAPAFGSSLTAGGYASTAGTRQDVASTNGVALKPLEDYPVWATKRVYEGQVTVPCVDAASCRVQARLDLGKVYDWATVYVNGRAVKRLWCAPYEVDLTPVLPTRQDAPRIAPAFGSSLTAGGYASTLNIRVEVTSTIHNLLSHEAELPAAERTTWTICGPGKGSVSPAGLVGPVRLLTF